MEEQETNQKDFMDLSEQEPATIKNDAAPAMDFTMPEITIEDIFDSSLLPGF